MKRRSNTPILLRYAFYLFCIPFSFALTPDQILLLSPDELLEKAGEPIGVIEIKNGELWFFNKGEVRVENGIITTAEWMSDDEYKDYLAEMARKRAEGKVRLAKQKEESIKAAEQWRDDKLSDPVLLKKPLDEQIQFWRNFKHSNPEVDIEPHFSELVATYKKLLAETAREQRLAELKERAARAEERAAIAEKEASEAKRKQRHYFNYGYYTPIINYPTYPRQPTIIIHSGNSQNSHSD